jgi:hypothetical protein
MNRQVIKRIVIAVFLMALVVFACGFFENQKSSIESAYYYIFVGDAKPKPNANRITDYPEDRAGWYRFDPKTILASLDQGKNVFISLPDNDDDLDVEYTGIVWTQADFLRVANVLSQKVWNEPLDMDGWNVYFILMSRDCNDDFGGFTSFEITYYKTIKTGWEMVYTARHIELAPWRGVAKWGGNVDFSTLFIFGWKNIELTKFKITAEQAIRIAEENGGKAARLSNNNECRIYVDVVEDDWDVDYGTPTRLNVFINPFTGEVHSGK